MMAGPEVQEKKTDVGKESEAKTEGDAVAVPAKPPSRPTKCPMQLQRETPEGLIDAVCGVEAPPGHGGLCRWVDGSTSTPKLEKRTLVGGLS